MSSRLLFCTYINRLLLTLKTDFNSTCYVQQSIYRRHTHITYAYTLNEFNKKKCLVLIVRKMDINIAHKVAETFRNKKNYKKINKFKKNKKFKALS